MKKFIAFTTAILGAFALLLIGFVTYYYFSLPNSFCIPDNSAFSISADPMLRCDTVSKSYETKVIKNLGSQNSSKIKLFGVIPIKTVELNQVSEKMLVPGGSPFGIKLISEGVIIVALGDVNTPYGYQCPAKDAGFQVGDIILSIDGQSSLENGSVSEIIENSDGKSLVFEIERNNSPISIELKPVFCTDTNSYKSGIWVRDSTAGIGTVTYYDPETTSFAGLGHGVCDIDTGNIIPLSSGEVGPVSITGVVKGYAGAPGELIGSFTSDETIGSIIYNTESGIFGTLDSAPTDFEAVPVAYRQDIQVGPAVIYSTIDGQAPQEYDILIEKIDLDSNSPTKNMVIRVVDEELLKASGGIVQGMSGSPIIQNNTIIGAVTHVFVNNPTMGYAIFCENMINSSQNIENISA